MDSFSRFPTVTVIALSLLFGTADPARAQCDFRRPSTSRAITYRFQPGMSAEGLVLHVTLKFEVGSSGRETLALPLQWAGETLHAVTNLRAVSDGASIEDGPPGDTKILHAPANRPVAIAYELKKDWTGPLVHPKQFHPVLMPEYFEFTGSNALVRLVLPDGAAETANFDWQELPVSWALATSFGAGTSASDRCQTYTGPWLDVAHGLYAAGDFRIHRFEIGRQPAVLAVRGKWTFTDDSAVVQLQKVVGAVRGFWQDDNFPYFLVTLKPYDQDHGSDDGSAFTNAFWMYVSRLDPFTTELTDVAHEAFHEWNPRRMGSLSSEAKRTIEWFREGFTSYYGDLLVYRAGLLSAAGYVDSLNRDLRKFPTSTDPYQRGRVIALWLDAAIRRESRNAHSLDDVMFDMVRTGDQPLTQVRIFETAGRYISPDARSVLHSAVTDHGDMPAPDLAPWVGGCAHASLQDLPTFELGLDLARSQATHQLTGVVDGGPAFAAGLREGQRLDGVSVYHDDPERPAKFTILTDAGEKQVTFYPRGKTVSRWQYHLNPTNIGPRAPCGS